MCNLCLFYGGQLIQSSVEVELELLYQNKMKQKLKKLLITVEVFLRAVCSPVFRGLDTVHSASSAPVISPKLA